MPTAPAKKVKVIEVGDDGAFGALLPSERPGVLQLAVQDEKGARTVVEMPASWRRDMAMTLLSLDGARVNVQLSWPQPKSIDVECPKCGAQPGEKCRRQDGKESKRYHKERAAAAKQAPRTYGSLNG